MRMKRLLADSCIYGELVVDKELHLLQEAYAHSKGIVVYGYSLIRKELRATPKTKRYSNKSLRIFLLSLYDAFVHERDLNVDENVLKVIAHNYYETYRQLGGHLSESELRNDYLIVACAADKGMDIIVSNDHASLLSEVSLRAYALVNETLRLKNPEFIDYREFKALLLKAWHGDQYGNE